MHLETIVSVPGGNIRAQENYSLIFETDYDGIVSPKESSSHVTNPEDFFFRANHSFKLLSAEIHSVYPVKFELFQNIFPAPIKRGEWAGRMNSFLCIQTDLIPVQSWFMKSSFITQDRGQAILILNGICRGIVK